MNQSLPNNHRLSDTRNEKFFKTTSEQYSQIVDNLCSHSEAKAVCCAINYSASWNNSSAADLTKAKY